MKTDEELRKRIMEELQWDPKLSGLARDIQVAVKDEVVTLSGTVDYFAQKLAAESAVQRVSGVKVVAVDIEVNTARKDSEIPDSKIAEAVRNALLWHSAVNEDMIEIKVDNGIVYFDGTVNWDYERKAAEKAVSDLLGVKGIVNRIKINNKTIEPKDVKRKIRDAFHRHATVDSNNVSVQVVDNTVTLSGKVSSWAERQDAEAVVWSMPGITEVKNHLEVDSSLHAV